MIILALIVIFATSSSFCRKQLNAKVFLLNNGSVTVDTVQRLQRNVDYLGLSFDELQYNGTDSQYRTWLQNTLDDSKFANGHEFVIILNSIPALLTSHIVNILQNESLFANEVLTYTCPVRACDEIKEVCLETTKDVEPSVILGRSKHVRDLFNKNAYKDAGQLVYSTDSGLNETDVERKNHYLFNHSASVIISCNASNKHRINQIANYLHESTECYYCHQNFDTSKPIDHHIAIALFVEERTPFLEQFFEHIKNLNYSKSQITLLIYNKVDIHNEVVQQFVKNTLLSYADVLLIGSAQDATVNEAKIDALEYCYDHRDSIKHLLIVSSTALIDNKNMIRHLISFNRSVIAPLLNRQNPVSFWTNFWGDKEISGFYKRSFDYTSIVDRSIRGIWNVPFVSSCMLMNHETVEKLHGKRIVGDPDLSMAKLLREEGVSMFVVNLDEHYGWLTNTDTFNASLIRPDLYQIFENPKQWTRKYVHIDFLSALASKDTPLQPVTDVFWFPFATHEFCDDLIATVKSNGGWSGASHNDSRLPGGYENVPTDDIHMSQIDFADSWHLILKDYIMPMQRKVFQGYVKEPPSAPLSFVVQYNRDRLDRLKPHHDSSTYTLNMALNTRGVDYEGGGVRFVRYQKDITNLRKGWILMHPGRLTHLHEGLPTTNGTRYILVSFVDP